MPQSLVKNLLHIVFSTKNREDLIFPDIEAELFRYFHGIVENYDSKLVIAGGTSNHVHLLISLAKTIDVSTLVGHLKRDSSTWIKTKNPKFKKFYWQKGFGAFSIGQSQVESVVIYIRKQKEHHQTHDFKDEYRQLLEKYGVEYDEKYVWD